LNLAIRRARVPLFEPAPERTRGLVECLVEGHARDGLAAQVDGRVGAREDAAGRMVELWRACGEIVVAKEVGQWLVVKN